MAIWAEMKAVKNVVDRIAACRAIKRFYPTIVAKRSGIPLPKVFDYLVQFTQGEMLRIKWEVRCPEYGCSRTIKSLDNLPDDDHSFIDCFCGEEVEMNIDNLFPVFEFNPEYRESVLSECATDNCKKKLKLTARNSLN